MSQKQIKKVPSGTEMDIEEKCCLDIIFITIKVKGLGTYNALESFYI